MHQYPLGLTWTTAEVVIAGCIWWSGGGMFSEVEGVYLVEWREHMFSEVEGVYLVEWRGHV